MVSVRPATLFARTPAAITRPAPTLGEHTDAVLREAGLSPDEITSLRAAGVIPPDTPTTETSR
jgi:crotonobetainyl-CoA:carnitine CoA-transferase CaiB-like acyl-CoA transferase